MDPVSFKCTQANLNGDVKNIVLIPTDQAEAKADPTDAYGSIEFELRDPADFTTFVVGQSYDIDLTPVVP
jgi:hypothetical protein